MNTWESIPAWRRRSETIRTVEFGVIRSGHYEQQIGELSMTYHGHIQNGVAVLDTPVPLPDGTPVRIEIERADAAYWANKPLADLASEQGIQPCADPAELAGDWPPNESVDDLMKFIRESRRS